MAIGTARYQPAARGGIVAQVGGGRGPGRGRLRDRRLRQRLRIERRDGDAVALPAADSDGHAAGNAHRAAGNRYARGVEHAHRAADDDAHRATAAIRHRHTQRNDATKRDRHHAPHRVSA